MLYRVLRRVGDVALDWFYAGIEVEGAERVPADVPLLVVANHPNQLVDALLVARALGRRVTFTGKAVLMENPVVATLGRAVGFVPLRRVQDEWKRGGDERERGARGGPPTGTVAAGVGRDTEPAPGVPADRDRNAAAFDAIVAALGRREAVLIFPEGISHDRPALAPIKTGAARVALQACAAGVRGLCIVAVGITFERKWAARSRVLVQIGEALAVDDWRGPGDAPVAELTAEVERRLRGVTLNFPTREAADEVLPASRLLAALLEDGVRPLRDPDAPLPGVVGVARRVELVRCAVAGSGAGVGVGASPEGRARVAALAERLGRLRATLDEHGVAPSEVAVETGTGAGVRFVAREGALVALGGPVALWGRLNHWAPLALARSVARRTSRNPEDPAMHTIVAGLVIVPLFYLAQTALVWRLAGGWWALAYLLSLPASAGWALRYADRLAHARRRVRAYLLFRRQPALREEVRREAAWLRREATAIASDE